MFSTVSDTVQLLPIHKLVLVQIHFRLSVRLKISIEKICKLKHYFKELKDEASLNSVNEDNSVCNFLPLPLSTQHFQTIKKKRLLHQMKSFLMQSFLVLYSCQYVFKILHTLINDIVHSYLQTAFRITSAFP